MLIQSHTGTIRIFPAIPSDWQEADFDNLRTYGAFLVSAKLKEGVVAEVQIVSEKGGTLQIENPFNTKDIKTDKDFELKDNVLVMETVAGEMITLKN